MLTKKTQFISVEIMLKMNVDPTAWILYFEGQGHFVSSRPDDVFKRFVYLDPLPGDNANSVIHKPCTMVKALPDKVRKIWDNAGWRSF